MSPHRHEDPSLLPNGPTALNGTSGTEAAPESDAERAAAGQAPTGRRWTYGRLALPLLTLAVGMALGLGAAGLFLPRQAEPSAEVLVDLAALYQSAGKEQEAAARLDEALAVGTGDRGLLGRIGELYRLAGRPGKAVRVLEPVVAGAPERKDYRLSLARSYAQAGRDDKAAEQYAELVAQAPEIAVFHLELGQSYEKMARLDQALAEYGRSVELAPEQMDGYYAQGELYRQKLTQYDQAAEQYRLGLEADPQDAFAYLARVYYGASLTELGRLQEAAAQLELAEEAFPEYASAPYYLGRAYEGGDRTSDALAAYGRALERKPDFGDALLALANLHLQLGDCDSAIPLFRELFLSQPGSLDARIGLARCRIRVP